MNRSPFIIHQEFISPLLCEEIVDRLDFNYPDTNVDNKPIKTIKTNEIIEDVVFEKFILITDEIMDYHKTTYRGTEPFTFEWFPESYEGEKPRCENSDYIKRKWIRTKDRDFTCILFLSDYQEKTPFDSTFEVYGGKLEFIYHGFGFNPQLGTLIIFPSGPNFINSTSEIFAGDLYQIRFHVTTTRPFVYNNKDYPGDYTTWFEKIV